MSDMFQKQFDEAMRGSKNQNATGPSLLNGVVTVLQQIVNAQAKTTVAINALTTAVSAAFPNWVPVPATAASAGVAGQVAYEAGWFYICVASNTWQRVAIATF